LSTRCDLDLLPLDLELLRHFGCHTFQRRTKFERNRIIHGRVIYGFHVRFYGVGHNDRAVSGVRGPNFTTLGQDIGRSSQHCIFVSKFEYLAAISNASGSKLNDVLNDAKFLTF